jgi:hypothetical protein
MWLILFKYIQNSLTTDPVTPRHIASNISVRALTWNVPRWTSTRSLTAERGSHVTRVQTCLPPSRSSNKNSVASNVHIMQARHPGAHSRLMASFTLVYPFCVAPVHPQMWSQAKVRIWPWRPNCQFKYTPTHTALMHGAMHTAHTLISSLEGWIEDHITDGKVLKAPLQRLIPTLLHRTETFFRS